MIDERAKRNPGFDERNSTWIALADGSRWAFPKPWLELHATFRDGRAVASCPVLTYGPDLEDLIHGHLTADATEPAGLDRVVMVSSQTRPNRAHHA